MNETQETRNEGEAGENGMESKRIEFYLENLRFSRLDGTGSRVIGEMVREISRACDDVGRFEIDEKYHGWVWNVAYCASCQDPINMDFNEFNANGRKEVLVETRTYEFTDGKSKFIGVTGDE